MFRVFIVKNDGLSNFEITKVVSSLTWDSNLSIKSVIEFTLIWNDSLYIPRNRIELGDLVIIKFDDEEVNRGIIVTENRVGREPIKYTAYDYGWYLGRSTSVYQFNNTSVSQAINRILSDFGMPIGEITQMNTMFSSVFIQKSPAEIITELIKKHENQRGEKIFTELREGKIYIQKMKDMKIIGRFKLASNIGAVNVLENVLGAERDRTIEDMRNQVKIILTKDDNYNTVALAQDIESGSKYGLLEETFRIDEEDVAKARQVANILLKRLNRVHEKNRITLMGDHKFKAGRIFDVEEPVTGMKGTYMITNCTHTVHSNAHTMDLTLTLPEDIS